MVDLSGIEQLAAIGERSLPSPGEPMAVAREFVAVRHTRDGVLTLRHWRGQWWQWRMSHWAEIEDAAVRAELYTFTEHARYMADKGPVDWAPNRNKIANALEAAAAVAYLSAEIAQPAWIDGTVSNAVIVSCRNGLLDVGRRDLLPHAPGYFNGVAVPFDFDPHAPDPTRWLRFLDGLWGDDTDQIEALRQWFGYTISGRTDLHKILLIIGPTRGGKGAICRVLGALVGPQNVAGPTLSSLRNDFGLQPLLGKPLAVISDARLNGRDSSIVVERLLSISGEDAITVNRKHKDQWTGRLPSRFLICSNELPRLGDASAAIAGRFVTLLLDQSWLGREDRTLERALHSELEGILLWALDGLARLNAQGRFTIPAASEAAYLTLQDLASPVRAFLRERCETGTEMSVSADALWKAWREWCADNGYGPGGTKQTFGRDLRAAHPQVRWRRVGSRGAQEPCYFGVAVRSSAF